MFIFLILFTLWNQYNLYLKNYNLNKIIYSPIIYYLSILLKFICNIDNFSDFICFPILLISPPHSNNQLYHQMFIRCYLKIFPHSKFYHIFNIPQSCWMYPPPPTTTTTQLKYTNHFPKNSQKLLLISPHPIHQNNLPEQSRQLIFSTNSTLYQNFQNTTSSSHSKS